MKKHNIFFAVIIVALVVGVLLIPNMGIIKERKEADIPVEIAGVSDNQEGIEEDIISEKDEMILLDDDIATYEKNMDSTNSEKSDLEDVKEDAPKILRFVDVFGVEYQTEIDSRVPATEYDVNNYVHEGNRLSYEDDKNYSRLGVDVSHHQGFIDWEKVKASGYDFAFIRIGYRGYGKSGSLNLDKRFYENIEGAHEAGIDVGVYFFSQAINVEEAREEAQFVIEHLKDYKLELPIVYDPESILDDEARTDNISGEQFTENTLMFCSLISEAGYKPMIYSNMLWEAFQFDMSKLVEYPFWYADYELKPQTPYKYIYWQYTNEGYVDGISGRTDLDIEIIEK